MIGRLRAALAASLLVALGAGCAPPADAQVLLDLDAFADNGLPGLRQPEASLDVLDDEGRHRAVEVVGSDGRPLPETVRVKSPLPMPCDASGRCSVDLRLRPGQVRFALHLSSVDRCGARREIIRFASGPVLLEPYGTANVQLLVDSVDFDEDGDGLVNVMEHAVCGRYDVPDGTAAPAACATEDDACCIGTSPLEGQLTAFAGGPHLLATGQIVDVEPFALDATEVTWRQLARCVAAGGCLQGQPGHPARVRLAAGVNENEPVTGLAPAEAEELCAFFGKRLPLDEEWDFAAAHRAGAGPGGERGRYPWSEGGGGAADGPVECRPDAPGLAANHAVSGKACPGAPVAVGSYPSTWVARGAGAPLADLGGNVAEWTLLVGGPAPRIDAVPEGTAAVVLRGGGATSPLALLENDLPVIARPPPGSDPAVWEAQVLRLAAVAGFRCALDVADGSAPVPSLAEPACGP
jgi:formylglycine-generating enzyme required for sulfatase activity